MKKFAVINMKHADETHRNSKIVSFYSGAIVSTHDTSREAFAAMPVSGHAVYTRKDEESDWSKLD